MNLPLGRPLPLAFRPAPGIDVEYAGRHCLVIQVLALGVLLVEDLKTQERHRVQVGEIRLWSGVPRSERRRIPDLTTLGEEKLAEGERRREAIEALLVLKHRSRKDVKLFADELGLGVSMLYRLMERYQQEGSLTCLIPHAEKGRKRKKRLHPDVEAIVEAAIDEFFMTPKRERAQETIKMVNGRCRAAGLKPPSPTTIRLRIDLRDAHTKLKAREGGKVARDRIGPVYGPSSEVLWPLQRVQIDHTVADMFVVDPVYGLSVTRPVLTLAIDEFSRCVFGFCLRIARPSTLSVALALTHGILPKDEYCRRLGIESRWDICGIPDCIFSDNAAEFDSTGLQLGCKQWGINGLFRPLGEPHFGGRIERLIGTMMGKLRLVPGATMSSVAERGKDYDPEKHAAYTLEEAERRIAIMIADIYHREEHSAIGTTPLKLYEFGILGDDRTPGRGLPRMATDPERLLIDFLPAETRSVQDYGIQVDYVRYQAPVLRAMRDDKNPRRYTVRYNPDDMSRLYLYDDAEGLYHTIPYAQSYRPPAALWEIKAATAHLKAAGRDPHDEDAVFRTIERLRAEDAEKAATSKRARQNQERRREAARSQPPAPTVASLAAAADAESSPASLDPNQDAALPEPKSRRVKPIADVEGW